METKKIYIAPITEFANVEYEDLIAATITQDDWGEAKGSFFNDDEEEKRFTHKSLWDE